MIKDVVLYEFQYDRDLLDLDLKFEDFVDGCGVAQTRKARL